MDNDDNDDDDGVYDDDDDDGDDEKMMPVMMTSTATYARPVMKADGSTKRESNSLPYKLFSKHLKKSLFLFQISFSNSFPLKVF